MNTAKKYFLYTRKSSEGEDRQITSIEDQITECKKLANELNIEIVDIISEAKSAKAPGRKGFNQMIERIQNGEADGILCWKLNRLARNPIDGGNIIWLLQNGVIQHIQSFGRDYKPTDNVIVMYVELGMSNQYVNDLSFDTKRGMRSKAERGWYPVSKLPIGYLHNPNRTAKGEDEIIIDPDRFHIVSKLWKLMLIGIYSVSDLKREADLLGLVNPKGKPYSLSSFHYMFSQEFYSGYYYWRNEHGNKTRHLGNHRSIISPKQFLEVQKILGNFSNPTRLRTYKFPFRGLLSCGECQGFVTAEHKLQVICTECKHKFSIKRRKQCPKCHAYVDDMKNPSKVDKIYYHCNKKTTKNCTQKSITETQIRSSIIEKLNSVEIGKDFWEFSLLALKELNKPTQEDKNTCMRLSKRKTELENRTQNLIKLRADGEISKDQLQNMQESIYKEIQTIDTKIEDLQGEKRDWVSLAEKNIDFAYRAKTAFKKGCLDKKRQVVKGFGSNLILKDKSLYFPTLLALNSIKDCERAYKHELSKVEPKKDVVNKGSFKHFDSLFTTLLPQLNTIRTCHSGNWLN